MVVDSEYFDMIYNMSVAFSSGKFNSVFITYRYLLLLNCRRAHVLFTLFVFVCAQWCPTYSVLYFCFCLSCVTYVVSFSGLFLFSIAPSVFSNVYYIIWLCNLLTLSVPDEGYFRNASCSLN